MRCASTTACRCAISKSAPVFRAMCIDGPLAEARERDWLEADDAALRPTESGRRFLNDLIGLFLTE